MSQKISVQNQSLNENIPWYQRRLFWAVVIFLQISLTTIVILPFTTSLHAALLIVTGGWFFIWFAVLEINLEYIHLLVQIIVLSFLLIFIFRSKKVPLIYPLLYLSLAITSSLISYNYLANFS